MSDDITPLDWFFAYLNYKARMYRMHMTPCSFMEFLHYVGER